MLAALIQAKLKGFYAPELEDYYNKYDNFHAPLFWIYIAH